MISHGSEHATDSASKLCSLMHDENDTATNNTVVDYQLQYMISEVRHVSD